MKRCLISLVIVLLAAGCINFIAACAIAQYGNSPPCSLAFAQDFATRKIFREPNPTPPIWPEFEVSNWSVEIQGRNPQSSDPAAAAFESGVDRYIIVSLRVGWPFRSLQAETQYTSAGWTKPSTVLHLSARPDRTGRLMPRDLPLGIRWLGFAGNSLAIAGVMLAPIFFLRSWKQRIRKNQNCCPSCGYPKGRSPVCTECGVPLS